MDSEYTAVILAASYGDRLYPLTGNAESFVSSDPEEEEDSVMAGSAGPVVDKDDPNSMSKSKNLTMNMPKHLLPVGGESILSRLIRTLDLSGFERCVILTLQEMEDGVQKVVEGQRDSQKKGIDKRNMGVEVMVLPETCGGSADALRYLYSKKSEKELNSNIVVMPGDLIVEGSGVFGWLVDAHRRNSMNGSKNYGVSACTMLLSDVGENDKDGVPLKESAKAKKGSFSREEEEIEFIGLAPLSKKYHSAIHTENYDRRVVFKTSKVDVEEDEDLAGKTPKLVIPKMKIMKSSNMGMGGLKIRTDLLDLHTYVFAPWIRYLLEKRNRITSLQEDLLPFLISLQFSGISDIFDESVDFKDGNLPDECFSVGAQILPRGSRIALRCCTIASYLFACRELVGHAVKPPEKMVVGNFKVPLSSTFSALEGDIQSKNNSVVLIGSKLPQKVTIKNSTVGRRVSIGEKCKLNNVVVMDDCCIGNETILQNTVISEGAIISNNCNLNDCQVGLGGISIPSLTKLKGEAIVNSS